MDTVGGGIYQRRERIAVGRFKLGDRAVFDQLARQRMHGGELLERIGVGRKTALGTLEALRRKLQLVEKHIAELDRRIEVELVPRQLVAFALEARELFAELGRNRSQRRRIDSDTERLHIGEHPCQRQLDFAVELVESQLDEPWRQRVAQRRDNFRLRAGRRTATQRREMFVVEVEQRRLGLAGIHQESGEHRIEVDARESHAMTAHPPDVGFEVMARFGRDGRTEQGGRVGHQVLAQNEGGRLTLALELQHRGAIRARIKVERKARRAFERVQDALQLARLNANFLARRLWQVAFGGGELGQQRTEFEFPEEFRRGLRVEPRPCEVLGPQLQRHIGFDSHELSRKLDVGPMFRDETGEFLSATDFRLFEAVETREQTLESAEMLDERAGGFLANAGDALDVIDGIAHQRHDIDQRARLDAETLAHLAHTDAPVSHRVPQRDVGSGELHEILVAGDDDRVEAFARGVYGERADDVIGFDAIGHDAFDAEGFD